MRFNIRLAIIVLLSCIAVSACTQNSTDDPWSKAKIVDPAFLVGKAEEEIGPYRAKLLLRSDLLGDWSTAWAFSMGVTEEGAINSWSGLSLQWGQPIHVNADGTMRIESDTRGMPDELTLWEWDQKSHEMVVTHRGYVDRYLFVAMDKTHILVFQQGGRGRSEVRIWFRM